MARGSASRNSTKSPKSDMVTISKKDLDQLIATAVEKAIKKLLKPSAFKGAKTTRTKSGYQLFMDDVRAANKKIKNPLANTDVMKKAGADWAKLKDAKGKDKKKYQTYMKKAAELKSANGSKKTEESDDEDETDDYSKMTVADLKKLAKEKKVTLPAKAKKQDIVKALSESGEESGDEESDESEDEESDDESGDEESDDESGDEESDDESGDEESDSDDEDEVTITQKQYKKYEAMNVAALKAGVKELGVKAGTKKAMLEALKAMVTK